MIAVEGATTHRAAPRMSVDRCACLVESPLERSIDADQASHSAGS
jgi:hypothetical protein